MCAWVVPRLSNIQGASQDAEAKKQKNKSQDVETNLSQICHTQHPILSFIMRNQLLIRMFALDPQEESEEEELIQVVAHKDCRRPQPVTTKAAAGYNEYGMTALHMACRTGSFSRVRQLLAQPGADVNAVDAAGRTALLHACRRPVHGASLVAYLITQHGAAVNACTPAGVTALHVACRANNAPAVRVLLSHGANVEGAAFGPETILHQACRRSHPEIVRLLVCQGAAHVNAALLDGTTPLHRAVYTGNLATVQCLVEHGAAAHRSNDQGVTPLHVAYTMQQYEIAEYLLEHVLSQR